MGWHTFRHSVRTMLAEMGEHQLTIRDYLRHSNLHVTNKYLQATFGGAVTLLAGLTADTFGPGFGGLFLAFPAIFPAASLTEKHQRKTKRRAGGW